MFTNVTTTESNPPIHRGRSRLAPALVISIAISTLSLAACLASFHFATRIPTPLPASNQRLQELIERLASATMDSAATLESAVPAAGDDDGGSAPAAPAPEVGEPAADVPERAPEFASTAETERDGDSQTAPIVEQPESPPPEPRAEPPVDVESLVASATERLIERIRELEERFEDARNRDLERIELAKVAATQHTLELARTAPEPSSGSPASPAMLPASLISTSEHLLPKPAVVATPARTPGFEVAAGFRCNDRHCSGRHLRVTSVSPNSPATRLRCSDCGKIVSLSTGDVILQVNSVSVASVEALRQKLNQPGRVNMHVMQHASGSHKDLVMENF